MVLNVETGGKPGKSTNITLVARSQVTFRFGSTVLSDTDEYKYLCCVLDEHLSFKGLSVLANSVDSSLQSSHVYVLAITSDMGWEPPNIRLVNLPEQQLSRKL